MARDKILCYEDYRDEVEPVIAMHGKAEYIDFLAYFYRRSLGQDLPEYVDGPATPVVSTQVNAGRWLWQCVACRNAVQVSRDIDRSLCTRCGWQGWVKVQMPNHREEIENELLQQPGFRLNTGFRHWIPSWTLAYLQQRTTIANQYIKSGIPFPRKASIGGARIWAVGEVLSAFNLNTFVSGPIDDLAGRDGPIELESALVLDSFTNATRNALTAEAGMLIHNATTGRNEQYTNEWEPIFNSSTETGEREQGTSAVIETVQHTLGVIPKFWTFAARCIVATTGYDIDDVAPVPDSSFGIIIFDLTSTNYKVRVHQATSGHTAIRIPNKATGALATTVAGNWAFKCTVYG